jgi:hypothetical protein
MFLPMRPRVGIFLGICNSAQDKVRWGAQLATGKAFLEFLRAAALASDKLPAPRTAVAPRCAAPQVVIPRVHLKNQTEKVWHSIDP